MSTFIAKGNLGTKPALKYVDVKSSEEARPVAEMRVYFDHRRPDGEGGYKDEGGFWADVTIWGKKAESVAHVLPKGARVCVFGTLYKERWADKRTGETREADAVLAEDITLDLGRVEAIELRPAKAPGDSEADSAGETRSSHDPETQPAVRKPRGGQRMESQRGTTG